MTRAADRCAGEGRMCPTPPAHVMLFEAGQVRWSQRLCDQHHAQLLELIVEDPSLGELIRTTPIRHAA